MMLCDHTMVPLKWSKEVESPGNGGDTGIFFTYNLYKARSHMVQSHGGVMIRETQSSMKRNSEDSDALFGNHEEKANIWCTRTFMSSPFFSTHVTLICSFCAPASLSTIPPGLSLSPAPHSCFPLFTSSLLSLS